MVPGACPVCAGTNARTEMTFTVHEAARFFEPTSAPSERTARLTAAIRRLWGRDTAANRVCNECDFGFADPHVAGDGEFYDLFFGSSEYPAYRWEFEQTLRALKNTRVGELRALEVGAGQGHFLAKISPSIYRADKITALEYNPSARVRLAEQGFDARATDLRELDLPAGSCDAIFLFQVLEHLDRPHEVFARVNHLLAPGGHIFFAVPNVGFLRFISSHGSLADVPPNHIGRWTPLNFRHMAGCHGLEVLQIEDEPFSLSSFAKQDAVYSYKQRAVEGRGLATRLYPARKTKAGRVLNAAAVCLYATQRLPVWCKAFMAGKTIGASRWCHMRKLG